MDAQTDGRQEFPRSIGTARMTACVGKRAEAILHALGSERRRLCFEFFRLFKTAQSFPLQCLCRAHFSSVSGDPVDDTTTLSAEKQQCEMTILVHHKLKD
jgi:hypothetical protein